MLYDISVILLDCWIHGAKKKALSYIVMKVIKHIFFLLIKRTICRVWYFLNDRHL